MSEKKKDICGTCGEDKNRSVKPLILNDNPVSISSYLDERCSDCQRIPTKKEAKRGGVHTSTHQSSKRGHQKED